MSRILLVEDDKMLNNGISFNLKYDGFEVITAFSLYEAREKLSNNTIDMVILDVNLPDGNGFDFCKEVREKYTMPILFLTACDMELDILTGFKLGADDYVTKPFSLNILRERILALFRRYGSLNRVNNIIVIDELVFDFDNMSFSKKGENIILAPTEYKIIKKLIENKGQVVTREVLLNEIWDNNSEFIEEHALTVNINRLRKKIEDNSSKPKYIKTIYGIGYMWVGDKK